MAASVIPFRSCHSKVTVGKRIAGVGTSATLMLLVPGRERSLACQLCSGVNRNSISTLCSTFRP